MSFRQTKQKEPLMGVPARSNRARVPWASSRSTTGAYRKETPRPSATRDLMVEKSLMVATLGKLRRVRFWRRRASSKMARVPEPVSE